MGHGKTAIPKPATSSVARGREPGGQPTSHGWVVGVNPLAPLSGTTNNIMDYQKQAPRLDSYPK